MKASLEKYYPLADEYHQGHDQTDPCLLLNPVKVLQPPIEHPLLIPPAPQPTAAQRPHLRAAIHSAIVGDLIPPACHAIAGTKFPFA
ncbi:hypothetical protein ACFX1T_022683 [Malus domestica]